jgi:hydrogenase maturation protein HypF
MNALRIHVTGIVQGVGFRPFVYNLACERGLAGWVLNASDGVHVLVQGSPEAVGRFPAELRERAPAMAVIEEVIAEETEPEPLSSFTIRDSIAEKGAMTLVSPDIATCPACLGELNDPVDRRYGYPFTNCTNCGPRFTIIEDVPYDRPMTTMREFEMCEQCAAEYGDPSDRRFHAQPNACFICGPRLYLHPGTGASAFETGLTWDESVGAQHRHRDADEERRRSRRIIEIAAGLLGDGSIVAIKGLGGFQLACDATNEEAVARLRERKHRWGKPLAVMVADVESARQLCEVGEGEEALLTGTVRPIVLLRRRKEPAPGTRPLAPGIAEGLAEVGVMLPYTPLHHVLLQECGVPLVMTSGNLSDEPIATGNAEALARLGGIADAFLLHDRDIYSRYDDSVVRVVTGIVEPVRRARGYAPYPLRLPFDASPPVLGAGPEQKNTFALFKGEYGFVSQHIGDLENAETLRSYEETLAIYKRLFRIEPELVAYDLHPEYLSTKWALSTGLPAVGVQHHHAHIASVTAEHGVSEAVCGIAFDGTGYGEDGRIWGGEVLIADWREYRRFAHLRYVPMPGGAGAIRRPARMAIGTLHELGLLEHPGAATMISRLAAGELETLSKMIERRVNSPLTSSMGRLFDTVSAIIGVADDSRYEGEAAILLEACADVSDTDGAYAFGFSDSGEGPLVMDPEPVLRSVLDDLASGVAAATISARFHRAVVECIVSASKEACEAGRTTRVALAGGVFMNRILLGEAVRGLRETGLTPLTHKALPMNDAAISFGQATVGWARRNGPE